LVLKQQDGRDFFIAAGDSIVIPIESLSFILLFLLKNDFISQKVLEGILEEYNSSE
jgi:hypothetical protein